MAGGVVMKENCRDKCYSGSTMRQLKEGLGVDADQRLAALVVAALVVSLVAVVSYTTGLAAFFGSGAGDAQVLNKQQLQVSIPRDPLGAALEAASFKHEPNRTVILAVLNRAYTNRNGMLDLFLESLREVEATAGLVGHVLFVAVDNKAYRTCRRLRLHCYKLTTPGVDFSREEIYMSQFFMKMMWRRTQFLAAVLRRGYSFVFTDMDVVWLRNPFPLLLGRSRDDNDDDLQFSVDGFCGDPYSEINPINTGFYFARANNKTIALFDAWYAHHDDPSGESKKDQDVLQEMKNNGTFRDLGLRVRYLDTNQIAGFCRNSGGFNETITVHANCCRTVKAKLADLSLVLREWDRYRREGVVSGFRWPKFEACQRSWKINMHYET